MNYLAHALLSFGDPAVTTGNMISDFVKGRKKLLYPPGIQRGIQLHRLIDSFTDQHPVTKEAKDFFRPVYRLYSGAFIDIIFDHFLANDKTEFPTAQVLLAFTRSVYTDLQDSGSFLPNQFASLFPYMQKQNWLFNYRLVTGIHKSFNGLIIRAKYIHQVEPAITIFSKNYNALKHCYEQFFPELKQYALSSLDNLRAA